MRGKDGKNLEESILTKFSELDGIAKIIKQNRADVKEMYRRTEHCIQKCGIVKYDAFNEMGGNSALPWHFWTVIIPDGS